MRRVPGRPLDELDQLLKTDDPPELIGRGHKITAPRVKGFWTVYWPLLHRWAVSNRQEKKGDETTNEETIMRAWTGKGLIHLHRTASSNRR